MPKRAGILTYVMLVLLALFGVVDVVAEVEGDGVGKYGETFSTLIAHIERRAWIYRLIVLIVTVVFASHLTFQTPLVPGVV
jgi:hypothetical protein